MKRVTTTILRHWLDEIVAGRKTVEYRDVKPYWTKRLEGIETPFELRIINGMRRNAPEATLLIERVSKSDGRYELHIARVLDVRNMEHTPKN